MRIPGIYFIKEDYKIKVVPKKDDWNIEYFIKKPLKRPKEKNEQFAWNFLTTIENREYFQTERKINTCTALVIDYDSGITIEDVSERFKEFSHYIYTSWSHKEEHHKFRLILPLVSAVPYDYLQEQSTKKALEHYFNSSDPSSFTHTRKMYMPYEGPFYRYVINEGKLFDIAFIEEIAGKYRLADQWKKASPAPPDTPRSLFDCQGVERELYDILSLPDGSGRYALVLKWIGRWKKRIGQAELERILLSSNYKHRHILAKLIWKEK